MSKKDKIIKYFKDKIRSGEMKSGEKIASEKDLAVQFGVSRTTLRLALNDLAIEKLIDRKLGDGTYISSAAANRKYIILGVSDVFSKDDIFYAFQYSVSKIRELLIKKGYKVFVYNKDKENRFFDIINISPNDIACWINGNSADCREAEEMNIPIIQIFSVFSSIGHRVTIDRSDLYNNINTVLKRNNIKDALIFIPNIEETSLTFDSIFCKGLKEFFSKEHIPVFIDGDYTSIKRFETIRDALIKYKDTAKAVVFSDDTFYKQIQSFLGNNPELIKNKKIISHVNYPDPFIYADNICKIEFNLDEFAKTVCSVALKLINKELANKTLYLLPTKIRNEEILTEK